jgi:hypothetical protein
MTATCPETSKNSADRKFFARFARFARFAFLAFLAFFALLARLALTLLRPFVYRRSCARLLFARQAGPESGTGFRVSCCEFRSAGVRACECSHRPGAAIAVTRRPTRRSGQREAARTCSREGCAKSPGEFVAGPDPIKADQAGSSWIKPNQGGSRWRDGGEGVSNPPNPPPQYRNASEILRRLTTNGHQ